MMRFVQMVALKRVVCIAALSWPVAMAAASGGQGQALKATANTATAAGTTSRDSSPTLQLRRRYHIQPGDVLELSFPLTPEFNQTITVTPDGYVALRGVGEISVAGLSLPELREELRKSYSGILHDPLVNVDLKDFQKPYFTVGGQVGHPGKYELREDTTVAEALAIAGGMTTSSKSSQILLFRHLPGGSMMEVRKLNIKKMLKTGDLREDARLQPGDLVYVPKNLISTIERFLPTSSMGMYATPVP